LRKLKPEEIQEGKVFHNNGRSVIVLETRTETIDSQSSPLQLVVFRDLRNRTEKRRLPIEDFCDQYQRKIR